MADDVQITAGAGTPIATDDAGGAHYQRIKLTDGTADSTAAIAGDAANGLDVDVTRVPADPFGANADAASTNGSLSAKLRYLVQAAPLDDAAFGIGTGPVVPSGFLADDVSADLVDEGDVGLARMTTDRRQIVQLGEAGVNSTSGTNTFTNSTVAVAVMSSAAGLHNYLAWITIYNSGSSNTGVEIRDGATARFTLPAPAFGGAIWQPTYPLRGTAAAAWNASPLAATTSIIVGMGGYRAST